MPLDSCARFSRRRRRRRPPPPSRHAIRSSFSAASRAGAVWIEPTGGWQARLQPPWSPASSVCVGWQVSAAAFALKRSAGSSVENGAQVGSRADPGTPPPLPFRGSHATAAPPPLPRPLSHTLRLDEPAKQGGTSRCCSDGGMVWGGDVLAAVAARPPRRPPPCQLHSPSSFAAGVLCGLSLPVHAASRTGRSAQGADQMLLPSRQRELIHRPAPLPHCSLQASLVRAKPPLPLTRRWVAGGQLGGRVLGWLALRPPVPRPPCAP